MFKDLRLNRHELSKERQLRISVVIPCFNSGSMLEATVESAMAQSYPAHELLLLDDGSTDDTWQRIQGFRSRFGSRLRIFHREKNLGTAMRNDLIREARGEWIANLDHDDLWLPDKLKKQYEAHVRHPNARVIHTDGWNQPGEEDQSRTFQPTPDYLGPVNPHEALFFRNYILASSAVYHLDTFFHADGESDENEPLVGDIELWLRLSRFGAQFVRVPEPLTIRRVLASGQLGSKLTDHLRHLTAMYARYDRLNRESPRFRIRYGRDRVIRAELDLIHQLLVQPQSEHHEEAAERWIRVLRGWEDADRYRYSLIRILALSRLEKPKFGPPSRSAKNPWRAIRLGESEKRSLLAEWKAASRNEEGREVFGRETARIFRMGTVSPPFARLRENEARRSQLLMDRAWVRLERKDRRWRWFRQAGSRFRG